MKTYFQEARESLNRWRWLALSELLALALLVTLYALEVWR